MSNVRVVTIAADCDDPDSIKMELAEEQGDILFTSFMLPLAEPPVVPATEENTTDIPRKRTRGDSVFESREPGAHRGSVSPPVLTQPDMRLAGVPEPLVAAGFTYPSLGRLGNALLQSTELPNFKFHCIMHEATSTTRMARAMTMLPEGVRNRPMHRADESASSLVSMDHSDSANESESLLSPMPGGNDDEFGIRSTESIDDQGEEIPTRHPMQVLSESNKG